MQKVALKIVFLLAFTSCFFRAGLAQVYPVQLSTQLIPPYSSYLPDYGDPTNEKLKCILVLQDFSVTHRDVKLEITITGNGYTIKTKSSFVPSPITLLPGTPQLITSVDLAPYLQTQNLDFTGINAADYELKKILPEGYYSICIRAVDYYNVNYTQVSNESCNNAWFFLNDPPFLNYPSCEAEIDPVTPQLIIFQWTAMNLNSPNSVLGTEYDFELFELRPNNGIPNNVVQNSAPIFSIVTSQPFFQYSITEPTLYLGMKYVWRVRARDLSGRDLFKNEGWSQICTFTYGNINSAFADDAFTLNLQAQASTHRQGKVWWNLISNFSEYHIQIRKAGTENWFDYYSTVAELKINELEPSTTYEARVMGTGNNLESAWSNTASFTTPPLPDFNCNDQTQPINALSANPLLTATPYMIFQIGQFEMTATSINPDGAPGYFSGLGKVQLYGLNIGVEYNHVYINDNLQITSGNVVALSEGIDSWVDGWMVDQAMEDAIFIEGDIDSIYVEDSLIYVVTAEGETLTYPLPDMGHPLVINDSDGSSFLVSPDGTVTELPSWLQHSSDHLDATENMKIVFSKSEEQVYGFDEYKVMQWAEDYEVILLQDSANYFVSNKSIKSGGTDFLMAEFSNSEISLSEFSFATANGQIFNSEIVGNKIKIRLENLTEDVCIYAKAGNLKMGKLNVKVYEEEEKEVVVIPLGNLSAGDITTITNTINQTFSQAVYKWNVSLGNSYSATNWDDNNNGKVDIDDYSLLNKYSDEMDQIRNGFDDSNIDGDAYILFVVPGFGDATVDGYMPYGRRFGFIKAGSNAKTFAHELGHGAFGLQHTFPDVSQNSTDNLLDYGNENHLADWQWDWMRDGHWLENIIAQQSPYIISEEEFETEKVQDISASLESVNFKGFYVPSGKFITPNQSIELKDLNFEFLSGGVYNFTFNQIKYYAVFAKNPDGQATFVTYIKDGGLGRLRESLKINLEALGYANTSQTRFVLNYADFKNYIKEHPEEIFTEFTWTNPGDKVCGNYFSISGSPESRKCYSSIIQWNLPSVYTKTGSVVSFDANNDFAEPLWGVPVVLTDKFIPKDEFGNLDYLPINSGANTSVSSTGIILPLEELYCKLVTVFDKGGWGRFTIERLLSLNGISFQEIKKIYEENPEILQLGILKSEVLDEYGSNFLNEVEYKWKDEKHNRLVHALVSINGGDFSDLQSYLNSPSTYKNYIQERVDRYKAKIRGLNYSTDQEYVLEIVSTLTPAELEGLDVETRIEAIKAINSGALWQNFIYHDETKARIIFQLVKDVDIEKFLSKLVNEKMVYEGESTSIIYAALNNLNGAGLDVFDGAYSELVSILRDYTFKAVANGVVFKYRTKDDISKLFFQNIKSINQSAYFAHNLEIGDEAINANMNQNGFIRIEKYYVKSLLELNPNWQDDFPISADQNIVFEYLINRMNESLKETKVLTNLESDYDLHPFELVSIYFEDKDLESLYQLPAGQAHLVPALYLQYLKDQQLDNQTIEAISVTIDALSLVTGTYGFAACLKAGRVGMASLEFLDMVGSGFSLASDDLPPSVQGAVLAFQTMVGSANLTMAITSPKNIKDYSKLAQDGNISLIPRAEIDDFVQRYQSSRHLMNGEEAEKLDKVFFYLKRKGLVNISISRSWLDDLESILPSGAKAKITNWIDNGLDETKLRVAFENASDKTELFNNLENAKSIYHQRVYTKDWENIPGVINSNYVNNSIPEVEINASLFSEVNSQYNLPSFRAATFTENVELINLVPGSKIYRVTDAGGEGGAFWTLTPPQKLEDVIGGTAVLPEWNGFTKVVEYTVPSSGLKVWKGKAAAQPMSLSPGLSTNNFSLPGGEFQIFINDFIRNQSFKNAIVDVTNQYKNW